MAKFNQLAKAGEILEPEMKEFLLKRFPPKELLKLEKFGGRIQISVTAPFTDKKSRNSKLEISEEFIRELWNNTIGAAEKLRGLTKVQLKIIAKLIDYPVATKANSKEIMNGIVQYLQTPEHWKFIANSESN